MENTKRLRSTLGVCAAVLMLTVSMNGFAAPAATAPVKAEQTEESSAKRIACKAGRTAWALAKTVAGLGAATIGGYYWFLKGFPRLDKLNLEKKSSSSASSSDFLAEKKTADKASPHSQLAGFLNDEIKICKDAPEDEKKEANAMKWNMRKMKYLGIYGGEFVVLTGLAALAKSGIDDLRTLWKEHKAEKAAADKA